MSEFTITLIDEAQTILARLEQEERERGQDRRSYIEKLRTARAAIVTLRGERDRLANYTYFPGANPKHGDKPGARITTPDDANDKAKIRALDAKIARAVKQCAILESEAQLPALTYSRVLADLERRSKDRQTLIPVERPEVVLAKGERSAVDTIPRLRSIVADLAAERRRAVAAPLPVAAVKSAVRKQLRARAAAAQPKTMAMFFGGDLELPRLHGPAVGPFANTSVDAAGLLIWLFEDAFTEKLDGLIESSGSVLDGALTLEQRTKKLAAINTAIDVAEREEAAAVEQAIANGAKLFHRPDISPLAVLSYSVAP